MTEKILYYAETVGGEVPPAFPPLFTKISTNWCPSLYNWFNFWNGVIQLRQQDRVALSCGRSCQLANSVSTIIPKQSTMFLCLLSGNSYTVAYHYHITHPGLKHFNYSQSIHKASVDVRLVANRTNKQKPFS